MTDFHAHLLPAVDDGSDSVETSLRMLEQWGASADCICATPHFYADRDTPERFLRRRASAWAQLAEALPEGAPRIRLGAEVRYFEGIGHSEVLPELCLEGTRFLLLEMPFAQWTERMFAEVRQIVSRGITPVAAHLERYAGFNGKGTIRALLEQDILVQCNAEFFLTRRSQRRALELLRDGTIRFLGTDAHNTLSRAPNLEPALELIRRKLGPSALERLEEID